MTSSFTAYQGLWYDHHEHRLLITLASSPAGFLSAALVIWVHLLAVATWPVVRFALWAPHRHSGRAHSVFHAQRSLLLRNSGSAQGALAQIFRIVFPWGRRDKKYAFSGMPYLFFTLLFFLAWSAAAIFAPYIYTHSGGSMLLASSAHCGLLEFNLSVVADLPASLQYRTSLASQAQSYVQQCYDNTTKSTSCSIYPTPALPFSTTRGMACPAANSDICITTNSTVLQLDTGLLNSNDDLGINAPHYDQVSYRHVATCSPIDLAPFATLNKTGINVTSSFSLIYELFHMGPSPPNAFTFEYSDLASLYTSTYGIDIYPYYSSNTSSPQAWYPNTTLFNAPNADAILTFVEGNRVTYLAPVYDPIFSAGLFPYNEEKEHLLPNEKPTTVYYSSYSVTALLCTEQHQVCADGSSQCTPLVGVDELFDKAIDQDVFNSAQLATVFRVSSALTFSTIADAMTGRGGSALLASQTLDSGFQTVKLTKHQWELEVTNWFAMSLALLQSSIINFATLSEDLWPYVRSASLDPELQQQCSQQRVAALAGYVNFDFAAIMVVLLLGVVLMSLGLLFDTLLNLLARILSLTSLQHLHDEWIADGMFQVQRMALESSGTVQEWEHTDRNVPLSSQIITPGYRSVTAKE